MQRPYVFAAGRVWWVGSGTSKSGKPFAIVQIELAARAYGNEGKVFRSRVTAHDYTMKEIFAKGDWVVAAGDGEAKIEEGQGGRSFPVMVVTGRVSRMDVPIPEAAAETGGDDDPANA